MNDPRLIIRVCDTKSSEPLPETYLGLPDVAVSPAQPSHTCGRCDARFGDHSWVVTANSSFIAIDCSRSPRAVPA